MLVRLERHLAGTAAAAAGSRNAAELGLPLRVVYGLPAACNVGTFTFIARRRISVFLREKLQKSEEEFFFLKKKESGSGGRWKRRRCLYVGFFNEPATQLQRRRISWLVQVKKSLRKLAPSLLVALSLFLSLSFLLLLRHYSSCRSRSDPTYTNIVLQKATIMRQQNRDPAHTCGEVLMTSLSRRSDAGFTSTFLR